MSEPVPLKEALKAWVNDQAPEHMKDQLMAKIEENPDE